MQHNLYIARRENKLYQKDVAKKLRIDPQTYHLKESGKSVFTLPEAFALADYFDTTVDELFVNKNDDVNG